MIKINGYTGLKYVIITLLNIQQYGSILVAKRLTQILRLPQIKVFLALGFASGLPLGFAMTTLQAWYTDTGVDIVTIGALSYITLPWAIKFLWAPLMERYVPPFLGRRRGWILISQVALMLSMGGLAFMSPDQTPLLVGCVGLWIAFLSASQDISIDAFRVESFRGAAINMGTAFHVTGYRVAMIMPAIVMMIAEYESWMHSMLFMAALMAIGIWTIFQAREPEVPHLPPATLTEAVIEPWREWVSRPSFLAFSILLVFYKLGDAFATTLATPFLLRELNFSLAEVAAAWKGVGFIATILGVFIGGLMNMRIGLFRSLLFFGILQAATLLGFLVLAIIPPSDWSMMLVVFLESLSSGMGTAAYAALIMALCHPRFTATQFAMLSALGGVGRIVAGPIAGEMVEAYGWEVFFFWAFIFWIRRILLRTKWK